MGLEAYASDLNPVAVLINKAMIEIPPKFAGRKPVGPIPKGEKQKSMSQDWPRATGLAEDVRRYGHWMREEAFKRIGHLYPPVEVTAEVTKDRPDLRPYVGKTLTVITWIWARTVKSPNPAYSHVDVPLASTFMLSTKKGKEAYVEPVIEGDSYRFVARVGMPRDAEVGKRGTKLGRGANFKCLLSGTPITGAYIKAEGQAGRLGASLIAIVAKGTRERLYLAPSTLQETAAREATPEWKPDVEFFQKALGFRVGNYGMTKWSDLFTNRQLVALTTFSDLVGEIQDRIRNDAYAAGFAVDPLPMRDGGTGAKAYAEAIGTMLALTSSKAARFSTTLATWRTDETKLSRAFTRNDVPITWDFAETNPFSGTGGDLQGLAEGTSQVIIGTPSEPQGSCSSDSRA